MPHRGAQDVQQGRSAGAQAGTVVTFPAPGLDGGQICPLFHFGKIALYQTKESVSKGSPKL